MIKALSARPTLRPLLRLAARALPGVVGMLAAAPAWAQAPQVPQVHLREDPVAVLELFTSQGCSSCPPADALLAELGAREDVLALAYHVDYWDYIGWPDTFAHPDNAELQRAYVKSWGRSRIYTPQMVINGRQGLVASHEDEVRAALAEAYMPLEVGLALDPAGETVSISVEGYWGASEGVIWIVPYIAAAEIAIARGENEGHNLPYTHIAGQRQAVGVWDPIAGADLRLPVAEALPAPFDGVVVLIQERHETLPGAILGAAAFGR